MKTCYIAWYTAHGKCLLSESCHNYAGDGDLKMMILLHLLERGTLQVLQGAFPGSVTQIIRRLFNMPVSCCDWGLFPNLQPSLRLEKSY